MNDAADRTIQLAAYYFPGYHSDPATDRWHGEGWTEWRLVESAKPRYEGHAQPIVPAWGPFDEADPVWAERQDRLASEHGVGVFLFDWYWYDNGPFLNRALDEGYLAIPEPTTQFALMWANHDWQNIHPATAVHAPQTLFRGAVSDAEFDALSDHVIESYFAQPHYLRVDGRPYFSIYQPHTLVEGLGGLDAAARAIARLRTRAEKAGVGGVHINLIASHRGVLPGEKPQHARFSQLVEALGADSTTSYVWIHHVDPDRFGFPRSSYTEVGRANAAIWPQLRDQQSVPYYPNVTAGWDSSPRGVQTDPYEPRGYPWTAILEGNTPEEFEKALSAAVEFAQESGVPLVTINAWNEWTEGSYLLPDSVNGTRFLEACSRAVTRAGQRVPG